MPSTHRNFAGKLHRLTRLLNALSEHRWAADGFSEIRIGHLQPLLALEKGECNNSELAIRSGITKQSMSRLVNELITSGYIEVKKHEQDGRAYRLVLSTRGKKFVHYLDTTRYDLEQKLSAVMGGQKFNNLVEGVEDLLIFVEKRYVEIQ